LRFPTGEWFGTIARVSLMHCELFKIVLTASCTLIGGVFLLVTSQILTRFIVDPLLDFRRLLGEVGHTLVFNSQYLFNPVQTASTPEFEKAKRDCRNLASRLRSFSNAVPLYAKLARVRLVPRQDSVYQASAALIGLSNTNGDTPVAAVDKQYKQVAALLKIRVD
jgi:hypothetical protein